MKKWIVLFIAMALTGMIFWSCTDDSHTKPDEQTEIISDNTVIIDDTVAAGMESGSNETGTFVFTDGSDLSKVSVGSVIIGGATDLMPEGYLRKVISKTEENGKIVIQTEQAALTDAIEKCSFSQTISLDTVAVDSVWYADGVKALNDKNKFGTAINVIFHDNDNNYSTTDDQIKLTGSIQINPSLEFDFEIDDWKLQRFEIALAVTKELNALAVIGAAKEIDIAEWKIATFYMGTITMPTPLFGFPVVVTPIIEIYAKVDGTISANAKFGIVRTETNKNGAVYENSQWTEIKEHTENLSYNNLECNGEIELKAGVGAKLITKFYGAFGPYMSAEGYGKIVGNAHIDLEQLIVDYSLRAGVDAKIGLLVKIFSHVILDTNIGGNIFEVVLKAGEFSYGYKPVAVITNPADNSTYTFGTNVSFQGRGDDTQDGTITNNITWVSSRDGSLGTGTPLVVNDLTVGTHDITMTVTDSDGYTDNATIKVTISETPNNPPVINSMTASATSVQQGGTVTLSCNATDTDGDALTYTWTKTGGSLSTTTGTSTVWTAPTTVGTYTVTVTVSDGEASVNQSKTITVTETPNNPPVINSMTASATSVQQGGTVNLSCSASDADGDALTYTWTKTGGTLSSTTGTSTVWTAPTTVGNYTVTVTVSDGEDSVNQSKTINVYEATFIDITAPVAGAQWDLAKPYDIAWTSNFTDAVRIVIMKGGDSLSTIDPSAYNDGLFTYTVTYTHTPGTDYQIKLVNTADWSINDTSDYFTILDTPNEAPTCEIVLGTEGTTYTQGETIQILISAGDNDGTVDTLKVLRNEEVVNTMTSNTTSNFYNWFTEASDPNGSYTFKVIAVDDDGAEGTSNEITVTLNDGTTPAGFVFVQGGTFTMGDHFDPEGDTDELPLHSVTLSDFYMGATEVTQAEWIAVMGSNPSSGYGVGDTYPVYYVSWYSIMKYCNLRSMNEGLTPCYTISSSTDPAVWGTVPTSTNTTWNAAICNWSANGYRLPSEAEWEYASRGGIHNADNYHYSGSDTINDVAWYDGNNSPYGSKPVGTKLPNQLGLYDMSGNLWEWCWDWYGSYTSDSVTNPYGPTTGSGRVERGGRWAGTALYCRVAYRGNGRPYYCSYNGGFRLSRTP